VCQELIEKDKLDARVIQGFDLTAKGRVLDEILDPLPSSSQPVILLLDEVDHAFLHAKRKKRSTSGDVTCLADNPCSLLSFLDRMVCTFLNVYQTLCVKAEMRNVIVIQTTNKSLKRMEAMHKKYIGNGRVHMKLCLYK
jgi:hypothetical protein